MLRLAFLLAFTLGLAGCQTCSCDPNHGERTPPRPGDIVRTLRESIGDKRFVEAKACFSEELQNKYAAAMISGEFFTLDGETGELGTDGLLAKRQPISVAWPLGPGDVVESVDLDGDRAFVRLSFQHPVWVPLNGPGTYSPCNDDPRPRTLTLENTPRLGWRITAYDRDPRNVGSWVFQPLNK